MSARKRQSEASVKNVSTAARQSTALAKAGDFAALVERAIARYSVLSEHKQLFAAKSVTFLPTEEELRQERERDRRIAEAVVKAAREEEAAKPKRTARTKGRRK